MLFCCEVIPEDIELRAYSYRLVNLIKALINVKALDENLAAILA